MTVCSHGPSALSEVVVQFAHCALHPSLTGDLSVVRYVWDGAFSHAVGSYFRVRSSYQKPKNLKT